MKIAIVSTVLFEVPDQPLEQFARDFRRANELAIGRVLQTATGQRYTMLAIERFDVVQFPATSPARSFTCPRCFRTSYHPTDIAQRYCGACHRFVDS